MRRKLPPAGKELIKDLIIHNAGAVLHGNQYWTETTRRKLLINITATYA